MKTEYNINGQKRKGYILLKFYFLKIPKIYQCLQWSIQRVPFSKKHISRLRFPPVSFHCRGRKLRFISCIMGMNLYYGCDNKKLIVNVAMKTTKKSTRFAVNAPYEN